MKNVMPMQPYLVLDTDDYEVKKEMKSGISHFYEFSKKKSLKEEMKAVPDGSVDLLFGRILAERFLPQKAGSLRTDAHILGFVFSRGAVFCRKNFPSGIWLTKISRLMAICLEIT